MTYAEYEKQRLSEIKKQNNTANSTGKSGGYAEYEKQRLSGNATTTKTTQPANMPSYEEHLKVLESAHKKAQEKQQAWDEHVDKINSDCNKYMQSVGNTLNEKMKNSNVLQELSSKKNVITPQEVAKAEDEENKSVFDKFYDNVVEPSNQFNSSLFYNTGKPFAKAIYKTGRVVSNAVQGEEHPFQKAQEQTDTVFNNFEKAVGYDTTNKSEQIQKANSAGEIVGNTVGYIGGATALGGGPLGYGAMSGITALGNTNDVGDIAFEAGTGAMFGAISSATNNAVIKGIEKAFPVTNPLTGNAVKTGALALKNAIAGGAGTYTATATTGELRNTYNKLRGREVTKEDWIKPVWSTDTAVSTLVGAGLGAYSGTKTDLKVRAKYEQDVNTLVKELEVYANKFNEAIQNGDQQSALDIVRTSRNKLVQFSMNDYGGRNVDSKVMNEVANKWKTYLENTTEYYNFVYNDMNANVNGQAKLGNSTLSVPNNENSIKLSQNLQKNVENAQNNMQMSISDVQNTQATLPSEIQNFVENRNKVASGLNVQLDNTLNTDGVMIKNQDGTRTIKINPNSTRAYEFVTMHEMLHDLEGTSEYQELANFVKERAITHDSFEEAKQTITDKYAKYYQKNGLDMSNLNMDVETINDMTAQALGNQQFLNELAGKKPNVFMRIYNWVKNVLFDGQKTGKTFSERRADNKYLNELKKKFETAYNTAYKGNGETKYSIQTDNNGNKYVKVDTDQNIFDGKTLKEQKEIAKEYILKNFREKGLIKDNNNIKISRKTANEYTNPKTILKNDAFKNKLRSSTELDNLLSVSNYKYSSKDDGRHSFAKNGWDYYETTFQVGNKLYTGLLNIANGNNGKMLYDITNIKERPNNISIKTESVAKPFIDYSIPSTDSTVNNQYMQNNGNNTQGLENSSSFSLPKTDNQGRTLTKEQQEYFKDSKVRDEKGKLLEVYHGTNEMFTKFEKEMIGSNYNQDEQGFFFTDDIKVAEGYANNTSYGMPRKNPGNVMKTYLNLKNPLIIKIDYDSISYWDENFENVLRIANKNGSDGVIIKAQKYDSLYIAFEPNQIKNVDNTSPTTNSDIRYSQSDKSWSKYLKEYWDLMPNSTKTFGLPTAEELQAFDTKKAKEAYEKLYMVNETDNVDNIPIEQLITYKDKNGGGYREQEQINSLKENIRKNGIKNPIELITDSKGNITINDGNHRLAIAKELGIRTVPVKYLDENAKKVVENSTPKEYNEAIIERRQQNAKGINGAGVSSSGQDVRIGVDGGYNATNTVLSNETRTTTENSEISGGEQRNNNRPSIDTTRGQDTTGQKIKNEGTKERRFIKNVNTTSWIPEDFKNMTGDYTPISNAETLDKARERINNEDYQSVKDSFLAGDLRDATDTAIGELLMQKAINDKNYKDYDTITCALAEKLTRAGQAIQAASILKKLTPDGMIIYAQKQLKNARIAIENENKKLYEKLKEKGELPELNEEDTKFIYDKMKEASELNTTNFWGKENRQKEILIGQALTRIANKIPSTALDKVAGIRRNGLLLNLKTLKRNVGSNLAFGLQEAVKDIPATVADTITSFFTGKRTTKLPNISAYWKGIKKGGVEAVEDVKYGISTAGGGSKYELPSKVFKRTDTWGDILQKYKNGETKSGSTTLFKRLLSDYEDTAMFIVEGTDRPFWQGRFESELSNQMELNGLEYGEDIPTEEMLEIAKESADYATFKNENKVSRFLGNTRNLLNNGKAIGLADVLGLTFTNVPGSVASKAYDYSPFGVTKVLTEVKNLATKNGKFNQRKFVDAIGRVITGTGLGTLGVFLLKKGIIYGSYDDDKDVANMQKQMGIQENSINLSALKRFIKGEDTSLQQGDEFYNFDWIQPSSSSIAVGTDIYNSIKNGDSAFDTALKAGGSVIEQVQDMSTLGTFSDLFGGYGDNPAENIVNTALDAPSSFVSTLFNNASQYLDNTSRNTYDATSMKNTMLNKIRARIPSEKSKLAPNVNTLGEEMKTYENPSLYNTFSNPGYNTKYSATPVQEEIMKVYKDTSDRTIFPRKAENTITYQDTKVTLDPYQKATYQKAMGSYTNEQYSALLDSEFYNSLESEDKSEIMKKILDDATLIGKASVGVETKNYLEYKEVAEALDEAGIPLIDYYNAWFAKKEEEKKKAQKMAINEAVSDDLTISQRKELYKILNVD